MSHFGDHQDSRGERAPHLHILRDGREEQFSIQQNSEVMVTGRQRKYSQEWRRRLCLFDLREIEGLLLLLVVWSEVIRRISSAMVGPTIDCPVLEDAG